jgi:DUF4097 and DUF4098 domain-containing protein YvlB
MKRIIKLFSPLLLSIASVFVATFCFSGCSVPTFLKVEEKMLTYTESADANIHTIKIDYDVADVNVVLGGNELTIDYPKRVKEFGEDLSEIAISEKNGVLSLKEYVKRVVYLNSVDCNLTITLPTDRVFTLDIKTDSGDIILPDGGNYTSVSLKADDGDIQIGDSFCSSNLSAETDTGNITISNFTGANLSATVDDGNISLRGCSVLETVDLETDTGNIATSGLIQTNAFLAVTDDGNVLTDGVLDAQLLEIETDTGDVYLNLIGRLNDYRITVKMDAGESNVGNTQDGQRRLIATTDDGDIEIQFVE